MHVTLNATLMVCEKLAKLLKEWEMVMTPYNPCTWNAVVMKMQLTFLFNTYDLIFSHGKSQVVTNCIKFLDIACGKNYPLTVTRGKSHDHLDMTLYFRTKDPTIFTQCGAIKKFWMSLPEELRGAHRLTPTPENLF